MDKVEKCTCRDGMYDCPRHGEVKEKYSEPKMEDFDTYEEYAKGMEQLLKEMRAINILQRQEIERKNRNASAEIKKLQSQLKEKEQQIQALKSEMDSDESAWAKQVSEQAEQIQKLQANILLARYSLRKGYSNEADEYLKSKTDIK